MENPEDQDNPDRPPTAEAHIHDALAKQKKLHNPFFLCSLFSGIRSIGYFDVCSVFIDMFLLVLTILGRWPYNGWAVISIFRNLAMLALISVPRTVFYALFARSNYHPSKSKQCFWVRLVTIVLQIPLYFVSLIQVFADKEYMRLGMHPAVDAIFEIITYVVIFSMNGYLAFLYFYYAKNGMDLHLAYLEGIRLKKLNKGKKLDEFGRPIGGQQPQLASGAGNFD
jgi:hypothetical protein